MSALLSVEGLAKSFGAVVATRDLSLEVEEGTIHAVIGPNGAGKTTLVAQLAGELRPDAGRILFGGRDITKLPVHRRVHLGLARSFQISNTLLSFTLLENVALAVQARLGHSFRFWADAARDERINREALAVLQTVGLAELRDRLASEVSHGERRLLEVAIALATGPKMLLLDEPMAGVGPEEGQRMVEMLRSLRGRVTILLIEHDMDAVFRLADRITVLVYGRSIAAGAPDEIRADAAVREAYLGEEDDELLG
ncbi:MAG TPA: ABC transporter ATP-binding protein [Azospirillum sp.]|nr:ABC transporter ATP-binding protein [Azospirillum sp.]